MPNETKPTYKPDIDFEKELFEAAVNLRGTVAPANLSRGAGVRGCRGEKAVSTESCPFTSAPPLPRSLAQEQERIDTTLRLCRMNLILHGLDADVRLGNSLLNDLHPPTLRQAQGRLCEPTT